MGASFLVSGKTLHPILLKSQCWCVDGESKFALRIRPHTYYRIELPTETAEDREQVEKLKTVLAKVLQYEVTPCPFKRGFYVELPEPPETPIIKRPWRPKTRHGSESPMPSEELEGIEELTLEDSISIKNDFDESNTAKELTESGLEHRKPEPALPSDDSSIENTEDELDSAATDDTVLTQKDWNDTPTEDIDRSKNLTRPKPLRNGRAVTAPPHLTLRTTPSDSATNPVTIPQLRKESSSLSSSVDSFHSFHSPISPLPPSPTFPDHTSSSAELEADIDTPQTHSHKRDLSELTIRAGSAELWELNSVPSGESTYYSPPDVPKTPPLVSDAASIDEDHWSEASTPSPITEIRGRDLRSRRRTHSPLPSSSNLYAPYSPRSHISGHHLTTAILQRTCSLLLGPPVQLVALMLRIAAKIARGTFRGTSYRLGESGQKIPCSWDFSSDGSDGTDDSWEEDDYGFSLSRPTSSKGGQAREDCGSWEID